MVGSPCLYVTTGSLVCSRSLVLGTSSYLKTLALNSATAGDLLGQLAAIIAAAPQSSLARDVHLLYHDP